MMTPRELFLELLKPDGQPDRQLCQYEALHMCLNDPINTYLRDRAAVLPAVSGNGSFHF